MMFAYIETQYRLWSRYAFVIRASRIEIKLRLRLLCDSRSSENTEKTQNGFKESCSHLAKRIASIRTVIGTPKVYQMIHKTEKICPRCDALAFKSWSGLDDREKDMIERLGLIKEGKPEAKKKWFCTRCWFSALPTAEVV
jgi:hypothetical protein